MKILNVEAITRREKYLFDVTKNKTDRKQNLKIFLQKFRASTVEILPNEFLKKTQFSKVFRIKEIARSLLGIEPDTKSSLAGLSIRHVLNIIFVTTSEKKI